MNSDNCSQLMQTLSAIPDLNRLDFKPKMRRAVDYFQGRFDLIRDRILYLDLISLGFRPSDPFDSIDWGNHLLERENLESKGDLSWAKLQVLNHGFDLIRDAALREGHDFPFNHPRLLFAQILREQRDHELEPIFGINQGPTLKAEREKGKKQGKLYRGSLVGTSEEKDFLEDCRTTLWSGFWIYAIWDYRFKGGEWRELRASWKRFMEVHKASCQQLNSSKHGNLTTIQWNQGTPVRASTKQPAPFERLIRYPNIAVSLHGGGFSRRQNFRDTA